jgi:hypothetical protein
VASWNEADVAGLFRMQMREKKCDGSYSFHKHGFAWRSLNLLGYYVISGVAERKL